jgi:hypothetical protein
MSFQELNRQKIWLLPPTLDELIPDDHQARLVSTVVDPLGQSKRYCRYSISGCYSSRGYQTTQDSFSKWSPCRPCDWSYCRFRARFVRIAGNR